MKAIILAGGKGMRLRSVIEDVPKPMAPVGGKPFLEYLLIQLRDWGIAEAVLSLGYKKEVIKNWFGDGSRFGMQISYSEEDRPLGTGGALKQAILASGEPVFLVMNGDSFFNISFPDLLACHSGKPSLTTLCLASVPDKGRYGSVAVDDDGQVLAFQKESPHESGLINGGIYLIDRRITGYIPDGEISLEGAVLPRLSADGLLYGRIFDGFFFDIGLPEDYRWIDQHPELLSAGPVATVPPQRRPVRGENL